MNYPNELKDLLLAILEESKGILPYFLLGVSIEAYIRTYKLHLKIRQALIKYGHFAIIISTLLGAFSPLCACGILPLTISLLIGGLPIAPAMSLLVASPLMSPAGYTIAKWELGLEFANVKLLSSIFMGVYAGVITNLASKYYNFQTENLFKHELPKGDFHDHSYPVESLRCFCNEKFSNKIAKKTNNKFIIFLAKAYEGAAKIGKLTLIGILIEVIAVRYMPIEWIQNVFGMSNVWLMIPIIILVAIPLHLNQITVTAIIGGITDKVGEKFARGAGLALLIGGPVTALPVMGVFLSLFKRKVFWLYIGICVSGTLIVSYLYQVYTMYMH